MEQREKEEKPLYKKWIFWSLIVCILIVLTFVLSSTTTRPIQTAQTGNTASIQSPQVSDIPTQPVVVSATQNQQDQEKFKVLKVIDGDTIDVDLNGKVTRLRLIGMDTPEVVDPRKPVQCFGREASNKAKELLSDQLVRLENDPSQGEIDKYGRVLRYVYLPNGQNFNKLMIKEGYAHEYTYNTPYKYQAEFKQAEKEASMNKLGLWGAICQNTETKSTVVPTPVSTQTTEATGSCAIKGNISSSGEKIFHVLGCGSYEKTVIDESKGERWFCSESEAISAGWRKALNCS